MTPNDIHFGEWVFAIINGQKVPVMIVTVHEDQVAVINADAGVHDALDYDRISPIPLTEDNARLFDWSAAKKISLQFNKETGKAFVRYIGDNNTLRKNYKLESMHQLQQWYYETFNTPLLIQALPYGSIQQ